MEDRESIKALIKEVIEEMNQPEFYTPEYIAAKVGVSEVTVRRWCRSGDLPYTKFNKFIRVAPKDFQMYCQRNRIAL